MFCPNCGASVQGRFCAKCGTSMDAAATPGGAAAPGAQAYGTGSVPGAQPYAASAPTAGAMSPNVAGALAYLLTLITGILFLVLAPYNENKFVRFHAFQSIFLFAAWIVIWIVEMVMFTVLPWALISLISMLVSLAFLGVWIFMLVKAYQGERFKLPVIGDLAEKQA